MNCKPGELAVIVNEDPGCECNIGAFIRVREADPEAPIGSWGFSDATRPLKMTDWDGKGAIWATDSDAHPDFWMALADKYLRPIRPDESPEESAEAMRRLHDTTVKQGEPA